MNLEQYRNVFLAITLGFALVAAYPMLAIIVNIPAAPEELSEFWLLGPEHMTADYPSNVSEGTTYKIFVALENHMGSSENYRIYVKFGNTTQLPLDRSKPTSLSPLYEFRTLVGDEAFWESPMTFAFQSVTIEDNVLTEDNVTTTLPVEDSVISVDSVIINGIVFPVDASTSWDSEDSGFYFRLSFELWRYDMMTKSFSFNNQVVGLRLNMTTS